MAKQKCGAYRRGDTRPVRAYAMPGVDIKKDDFLVRDATLPHYVKPATGATSTLATNVAAFVGVAMHGVKATDEARHVEVATTGDFQYKLEAADQVNVGDMLTIGDDGTNLVNQTLVVTSTASEALFIATSTTGHPDFDWSNPPASIAVADLDSKDEVEARILLANGVMG